VFSKRRGQFVTSEPRCVSPSGMTQCSYRDHKYAWNICDTNWSPWWSEYTRFSW